MYSPSRPRHTSCTPPRKRIATISEDQPGTVYPEVYATTAATTSSRQKTKLVRPSQVARRSGAAEKLVMLSAASRTILDNGYLVRPAARSAREYATPPLGNPSHGTRSR